MAETLSQEKKELIERIGVFHEHKGLQPLMGRIIGLLSVLEEAEATFEEIVEYLSVSKSAVSNALNFMQAKNFISYRTKPGERKRYFYLAIEDWENDLKKEMLEVSKLSDCLREVLKLRKGKRPEFNKNLRVLCEFLEYLEKKIPCLFEDFKKKKK